MITLTSLPCGPRAMLCSRCGRDQVGWDAKFVFSTLSYLPTAFRDAVLRLADRKCIKPAGAWVPMPRPKEISPAQFM